MIRDRIDRRRYPDALKLEIARQLRRVPTPAERLAWSLLRRRGILDLKFRRQHVICGFIVDFYCPQLRLVLELDGVVHSHPAQASYDAARTAFLERRGYSVTRVSNRELTRSRLENLVRDCIEERCPPSPDRERGSGGEVLKPSV